MLPQRKPAECPHRVECASSATGASCRLIADLVGLDAEQAPIRDDACRACVEHPVPTSESINPVIASLVSGWCRQLAAAGGSRLDERQLHRLQRRAWANLRSRQPDDPLEAYIRRDVMPCAWRGQQRPTPGEFDCHHPDHPLASEQLCRWCCDWSEARGPAIRRRLDSVIAAPSLRTGRTVQRWAVGVTTAPREQPTLSLALDTLVRAGWDSFHIFSDGPVEVPPRFDAQPITRRFEPVGAWPNFLLSLQELLCRLPEADAYLMVQDDAAFCDRAEVRSYLAEQVLWPGGTDCLVSLYCPAAYTTDGNGWRTLDQPWIWGALAFVFPRQLARRFVADATVQAHRWSTRRNGRALVDVVIGEWANRCRIPIHYPVPSLVQHVGHVSTVSPGGHVLGDRRASRFATPELMATHNLTGSHSPGHSDAKVDPSTADRHHITPPLPPTALPPCPAISGPLEFLSRDDFDRMAAEDKYYRSPERWDLYHAAIEQLRRLSPESVLELGPYRLPLVANGHTMDRRDTGATSCVHDARHTPWPIGQHYDVFIALQVWEHLEDSQQAAFNEVRRIASHALLSFPYRWNCPSNPSHHGITEATIREWTCGIEPLSVTVIPSTSNHRRILYRFSFT